MLSSSELKKAKPPVKTEIEKFFNRIAEHLTAYATLRNDLSAFQAAQIKLYEQEIEALTVQAQAENEIKEEKESAKTKKDPAKKIPALKKRLSESRGIQSEVEQLIKQLEQIADLGAKQEYQDMLTLITQFKTQTARIPTLLHTKTPKDTIKDFLSDLCASSRTGAVIFAKKAEKKAASLPSPMYSNTNYPDWELACAGMGQIIAAKRQKQDIAMPSTAISALAKILQKAPSPEEVKEKQKIDEDFSAEIKSTDKRVKRAAEEKRDQRLSHLSMSRAFFKKQYDLNPEQMKSIMSSLADEMERNGCDQGLNFSNPLLIGEESAEVKQAAADFLKVCFAEKSAEIRKQFHARMSRGVPGNAPRCIVFLTAEQECKGQKKKLCFVALSSLEEDQVKTKEINEFLKAISVVKTPQKDATQYIILDYVSKDFKKLIANLTKSYLPSEHHHESDRRCSEFGLLSAIAKLKAEHGSQINVTGVLNCRFYPYRIDRVYKKTDVTEAKVLKTLSDDKVEDHVCFTLASGTLDVGSEYRLPTIPLCGGCQIDQISYEAVYRTILLFNKMYTQLHGVTKAVQPLSPKDPTVASVSSVIAKPL